MTNSGRSTTGKAAVPYYLSTPAKEAAKHLRLTVTRYLADRATLDDIHEAVAMLVREAPVKGEPGYRAGLCSCTDPTRRSVHRCAACGGRL